ncbi:MAG: asparagine synthase B, partial [Solirubrobacterales bacterium]|nr:asparagine synthase B [Solirubrobacterales bacterium]
MCGLAGIWGTADESAVRAMMDLQRHRGPDEAGVYVAPGAAGVLGHRRLSIVDPEGGGQPLRSVDGRRAVIVNGEVYNSPELRPDLEAEHTIRTGSDSEVVLHLYEDAGRAVAAGLDGMYAFAVANEDELVVARDPIGIKPLFLGQCGEALAFASEIKALAPVCSRVESLPPGTVWSSRTGSCTFYELPDPEPEERPVDEWCELLRAGMDTSVAKHTMADVPVGAFLSGGLDSSALAALLQCHTGELHTFAVGMEDSGDLAAARIVARHLGTIHHEHVMTREEIEEELPRIIWHLESFDQDLVRSAIPTYFCARLAREHVTVVLTGEGADELFAGYSYHKAIGDEEALHRELRRSVSALHDVNLQRVDRMTMAHSLEARPPFLDTAFIDLALRVPMRLKLAAGAVKDEKWILRKAFEDLLPHEIVWRKKAQFDEGSGMPEIMAGLAAERVPEAAAREHVQANPQAGLRSAEEALYHRTLLEVFDHPEPILANVARWLDRPDT